ncbi:MAG: MYXO-CTERM sorting domain-containing protein [Kofleriaceae bacterium]
MRRGVVVGVSGVAALVGAIAPARAFSEQARFAEPAVDGGGGGRYFTGAPGDGLACSVCHRGGVAPTATVDGLPVGGFTPGQRYNVTVTWPNDGRPYALALELSDAAGAQPGVTLPALADQPAAMRCAAPASGTSAAWTADVGPRRVVGVTNCGAHQLTFAFTAPASDKLFFGLGLVATDGSETAEGDGVVEVRQRLAQDGPVGAGGCAIGGGGDGAGAATGLLVGLGALVGRRRRRTPRG